MGRGLVCPLRSACFVERRSCGDALRATSPRPALGRASLPASQLSSRLTVAQRERLDCSTEIAEVFALPRDISSRSCPNGLPDDDQAVPFKCVRVGPAGSCLERQWPPKFDPAQLRPLDLLVAGAQFRKAAGSSKVNGIEPESFGWRPCAPMMTFLRQLTWTCKFKARGCLRF
jgi:hypothetical protein